MTPNLVTPTELARIISEKTGEPFSRQAVHKAVGDGLIPFETNGRKKLVDLNNKAVKLYITTGNRQREQAKKKDITPQLNELLNIIVPSERKAVKLIAKEQPDLIPVFLKAAKKELNKNIDNLKSSKNNPLFMPAPSEKQKQKSKKQTQPSEDEDKDSSNLQLHDINRRTKIATMRAKELEVDKLQKKNLPTEFIIACYVSYIERLQSVLERSAAVFVQEIGLSILEAGEVQPKHINRFTDMVLEAIHNNKKSVKKDFEKYEPIK